MQKKCLLSDADRSFLERYQQTRLHAFRDLERYARLLPFVDTTSPK